MVAAEGLAIASFSSTIVPLVLGRKHVQIRNEASSGASASLVWRAERTNALADRIANIVERCPSLQNPEYVPPSFAAGRFSNAALSIAKGAVAARKLPIRRQALEPDLHVDWMDDEVSRRLPPDAPVVIFLHTITGSASKTAIYLRTAEKLGYRACVFVRRGHGGPLHKPFFNLMGDVEDVKVQVSAVKQAYPHASFTGMVGLSAGSGLLVSYLGHMGDASPVDAACSLCPAYDISYAFERLGEEFASTERYMLAELRKLFLKPNEELLQEANAAAFRACMEARSLVDFFGAHAPFALADPAADAAAYFDVTNPMAYYDRMRTPLLVINSCDDMVCHERNIREDLVEQTPGVVLLKTRRGSHVAFNEGLFGGGSYIARVSFEFLEAARHETLGGIQGVADEHTRRSQLPRRWRQPMLSRVSARAVSTSWKWARRGRQRVGAPQDSRSLVL